MILKNRNRFIFLSLLAISVLAFTSASRAGTTYPENPYVYGDGIYVSEQGVSRFDVDTLKLVWQNLQGIPTFEPVVTRNLLLVGSTNGLYALDRRSGEVRWRIGTDVIVFSPVVTGNRVLVAARDGSLQAVELETGKVRWRREFKGWVYPPAVSGDRLVVGGGAHVLTGLSAISGAVLWQKTLGQEMVYRPQAISDGSTIITLFSGQILAINPVDGSTRWQVKDNAPSFPPGTGYGLLYFRTYDGKLKARCPNGGRLVWESTVGAKLITPPYFNGGTVIISDDQGRITAFDAKTGTQIWQQDSDTEPIGSPLVINKQVVVFVRARSNAPRSIAPVFIKTANQSRRTDNGKISSSRCNSRSSRIQR